MTTKFATELDHRLEISINNSGPESKVCESCGITNDPSEKPVLKNYDDARYSHQVCYCDVCVSKNARFIC